MLVAPEEECGSLGEQQGRGGEALEPPTFTVLTGREGRRVEWESRASTVSASDEEPAELECPLGRSLCSQGLPCSGAS